MGNNNTDDLNVKPSGASPEGTGTHEVTKPETTPSPEVESTPESPSRSKPSPTPKPAAEETAPTLPETENDAPRVVDKTDTPTQTKEIEKPGDKLTAEADDEEERFIKEVEEHHGHL